MLQRIVGARGSRACSGLVRTTAPLRLGSNVLLSRGRLSLLNGYRIHDQDDEDSVPLHVINRHPSYLRYLFPRALPLRTALLNHDGDEMYTIERPACWGYNPSITIVRDRAGTILGRALQQDTGHRYALLQGAPGSEAPVGVVRMYEQRNHDHGWSFGRRRHIGLPPPSGTLVLHRADGDASSMSSEPLARVQPSRMFEGMARGFLSHVFGGGRGGGFSLPVSLPYGVPIEQQVLILAAVIATDLDHFMPWQRNDDLVTLAQAAFEVARLVAQKQQRLAAEQPRAARVEAGAAAGQDSAAASQSAARAEGPTAAGADEEWGARSANEMARAEWAAAERRAQEENARYGAGSATEGGGLNEPAKTASQMADDDWARAEQRAAVENRRWGASAPEVDSPRGEARSAAEMAEDAWSESERRAKEENAKWGGPR